MVVETMKKEHLSKGLAACNSQTASPFGCLNNFYFRILSNFLGSLQHPVLGVFLCDTVMNTRRCASNYIDKENGSRHQKE